MFILIWHLSKPYKLHGLKPTLKVKEKKKQNKTQMYLGNIVKAVMRVVLKWGDWLMMEVWNCMGSEVESRGEGVKEN